MDKVSFFDLDHTLLVANSSFLFGSYLYKKGVFPTCKWLKLACCYFLHKMGFLTLFNLQTKTFNAFFLNKKAEFILMHIKPFIEQELGKNLYKPSIERLEKAKKENHHVHILSNSPDFIVEPIAHYLGIKDWQSTIYEIDHLGQFSKISLFFQGEDKANYVKKLLNRLNLGKENTTAYSDSILDRPFLEAVGTPVAVNPDKKLKRLALKNHWEII